MFVATSAALSVFVFLCFLLRFLFSLPGYRRAALCCRSQFHSRYRYRLVRISETAPARHFKQNFLPTEGQRLSFPMLSPKRKRCSFLFYLDSKPFNDWKSGLLSCFAKSKVYSSKAGPDSGISLDLAWATRVDRASSTSVAFPEC